MAASNQVYELPDLSSVISVANPIRSEDAMKHGCTSDPWEGTIMRVKRQCFDRDHICSCLNICQRSATVDQSPKENVPRVNTAELEKRQFFDRDHTYSCLNRCHRSANVDQSPKQNVPGVNTAESPDDDEFIRCLDCNLLHLGDCPIHGGLIIVKDREVPADGSDPYRAENTLPPFLTIRESSIPKAGRGVFSAKVIPKGMRFGPYEGVCTDGKDSNSRYSWKIYKDSSSSHYIDAFNQSISNWMRFVNCPCREEQQNLMAFQYKGGIYYRTVVEIPQNTELLVWYGDQHGKELFGTKMLMITEESEQDIEFQQNNLTTQSPKPKSMEILLNNTNKIKLQIQQINENLETFGNQPGSELKSSFKPHLEQLDSQNKVDGQTDCHSTHCHNLHADKSSKLNTLENISTYDHIYNSDMKTGADDKKQTIASDESPDCVIIQTGKSHQCGVCNKLFQSEQELKQHLVVHKGEKPYTCSVGGRGFTQSGHLLSHQRIHKSEQPYICSVCGKGFSEAGNLQTHERTHTGEKPYACSVCGIRFTAFGSLHTHKRIHTGEKPYTCSVCGKGFSRAGNLTSHERTHTGEKRYTCSVCGKGFSRSTHLRRHQRTHTGEKPYTCSVCGKEFSDSHLLHSHQRNHTEETETEIYLTQDIVQQCI